MAKIQRRPGIDLQRLPVEDVGSPTVRSSATGITAKVSRATVIAIDGGQGVVEAVAPAPG